MHLGRAILSNSDFETITIGEQVWMKRNLSITNFRNGDPILEAKSFEEWKTAGKEGQPICRMDEKKFGKQYNWHAVNDKRGLAPEGWRIPTKEDFRTLAVAVNYNGNALKAKGQGDGAGVGTNTSGFSALIRGGAEFFWTSTEPWSNTAYSVDLQLSDSSISVTTNDKEVPCRVRCIRI